MTPTALGSVERDGTGHVVVCGYDQSWQPQIIHDPASADVDPSYGQVVATISVARVGGDVWQGLYHP